MRGARRYKQGLRSAVRMSTPRCFPAPIQGVDSNRMYAWSLTVKTVLRYIVTMR